MQTCWYLHEPDAFEALARDAGFSVEEIYGDYEGGRFAPQTSRFMVWILRPG